MSNLWDYSNVICSELFYCLGRMALVSGYFPILIPKKTDDFYEFSLESHFLDL